MTFDIDRNGVIDFKEFLLSIDVNSSGSPEEKLNWAFSMYDVDGNGYIDINEMTSWCPPYTRWWMAPPRYSWMTHPWRERRRSSPGWMLTLMGRSRRRNLQKLV